MLDLINKAVGKFFGTKSERDVKEAMPQVEKILEEYAKLEHVSNDELRGKTEIFKERINAKLQNTNDEIASINQQIEDDPDMDLEVKQELYTNIDNIKKSQKAMIEEVLKERSEERRVGKEC